MRRLAAIAAIMVGVAAAPAEARTLGYLAVRAGDAGGLARIVDARGRDVLLRGVNVDGLVDYWRRDLRTPYTSDPRAYAGSACAPDDPTVEGVPVCALDFAQMRPLGYDAIRLNLSWSLLEPTPGRIDQTYLDRIAQVVGWARAQGIYVVLDMHQDAWSKYVYSSPSDVCLPPLKSVPGYDGAPAWASAHVAPACALNGVRELDAAVQEAFQRLYVDAAAPDGVGLQEHFAAAVLALARRFARDPTVAGYELLNEPSPGYAATPGTSDATELFPFYAKVVRTVTGAVPGFRQLFFLEPNAERNVTDQSPIVVPWSAYSSYPNVVYAPHVYTGVFTADQEVASRRFMPSDGGYRSAIDDARRLGTPLWIGEFGNNPQDDDTILRTHYELQDRYLLGGTLWLWKENANDVNASVFWGVYGPPFEPGVAQPKRIALTSRAYPLFTAGRLDALAYDPAAAGFDLRARAARVACSDSAHATVVFLPRGVAGVAAEHARVQFVDRGGGSREAYVYPDGGAYRVFAPGRQAAPACPAARRLPRAHHRRAQQLGTRRSARFTR